MALPTALLVKVLGGLGVLAAGTTGIVLFLKDDPNKAINENIKKLGIDESCYFKENKTTKTCTLDKTNLKKITFVKGENEAKASGDDIGAELTIETLTEDSFKTDFPEGLRFTLKNTKDADLTLGTNGNTIILKPGVSYDFKIKDGTKLEKAWTIETLGTKVGLNCSGGDNATSCTLTTGKINVWKDKSNYILEATLATNSSSTMTVTKDTADYNQGFKLTVSADTTISQSDSSKKVGTVDKLIQTSTNNTSYEIDLKDHKGTKTWFLVEKDTTGNS